jgi:cell division protein FtsZ
MIFNGAKWILININSAEGEHECTMDELETINNHLRLQAGEGSDVIVGMGYDNSLDNKIGVTLIATGFENKDAFSASNRQPVAKVQPKVEKIVMTLGVDGDENKMKPQQPQVAQEPVDPFAPRLIDTENAPAIEFNHYVPEAPMPVEEDSNTIHFELTPQITEAPVSEVINENIMGMELVEKPAVSAGYLSRPVNIYAEEQKQQQQMQQRSVIQQIEPMGVSNIQSVETKKAEVKKQEVIEEESGFQLVIKEDVPQPVMKTPTPQDLIDGDDEEEQKRRAAERIQKLRNLSFNMNAAEGTNEFENVPAYVRRNMELFGNTLTSVENFYSKYTVKTDENNDTQISSLNTFLDGKKPD